jgi:hypothetical protein
MNDDPIQLILWVESDKRAATDSKYLNEIF